MERRSALRQLLSLGSRNVTGLVSDNYLRSSDQHEVKAICHALSSLYGRKLSTANLRKGAASMASYLLSQLGGQNSQLVGTPTPTQPSLQQYEIAKIGRREFLLIGGTVAALAVGSTLYYVAPLMVRTLTETVTSSTTLTETATTTIPTTTTLPTTTTTTTERTTSKTTTKTIHVYHMTVSTVTYTKIIHQLQGLEMYFETARRGKITDVRQELESEGTAHFQKAFYDQFGRRVPKRKLRVGFECEKPATQIQNDIKVQAMSIKYYDGRWHSTPMSQRLLSGA